MTIYLISLFFFLFISCNDGSNIDVIEHTDSEVLNNGDSLIREDTTSQAATTHETSNIDTSANDIPQVLLTNACGISIDIMQSDTTEVEVIHQIRVLNSTADSMYLVYPLLYSAVKIYSGSTDIIEVIQNKTVKINSKTQCDENFSDPECIFVEHIQESIEIPSGSFDTTFSYPVEYDELIVDPSSVFHFENNRVVFCHL